MSEAKRLCMGCMEQTETEVCHICGLTEGNYENKNPSMPVGSKHKERYIVGCEVAFQELGAKYIAYDAVQNKKVIIKTAIDRKKTRHFYKALLSKEKTFEAAVAHTNRVIDVPNYIPSTDSFMIEDEFFWVEPYHNGITLQKYIEERGKLPYAAAMHIFLRTAGSLAKLHDENVIYGTLSPQSIILTADSDSALKDKEFLVIKYADDPKHFLNKNFLPAEYFEEDGNITHASDVYSLACLLYYMLTGKPVMLATEREYDDVVIPPSALDIDIPKFAEQVLLKALGLYQDERIQSVSEFVEQMDFEDKPSYRILVDEAPLRSFLGVVQMAEVFESVESKKPSPEEVLSLFDDEEEAEEEANAPFAAIDKRYEKEHRADMQFKKFAEHTTTKKEKVVVPKKKYNTKKTRRGIPIGVKIGVVSFFGIILVAVALLLLGVLDLVPTPNKVALVPNVVGMSIDEAKSFLTQNGLTMLITGSEPIEAVALGNITSQKPVAESEIMLGDIVSLNVRRNEYTTKGIMPDLVYMQLDLANEAAKRNDIKFDVRYVASDDVLVGCVVSQSVPAGSAISGQTIELSVSSGSALQNARIRMSKTVSDLQAIVIFKAYNEIYDIVSTAENSALGDNMPVAPEPPEEENLSFIGWSYGENGTGYAFTSEQQCNGIVTVYAAFAPKGVVLPTPKPQPTIEVNPTVTPAPTMPPETQRPQETASPTSKPTPTLAPTVPPTIAATTPPTSAPTASPTPTPKPTASPTPKPTASPTPKPTASPTPKPTASPTPTPEPTPTPFIPVEGVSIAPSSVLLRVGERLKLSAIFTPKNATNKGVTWGVEDSSIVAIDNRGIITGISPGVTYAYVITDYGFFEATCKITIIADTSSTSLSIS